MSKKKQELNYLKVVLKEVQAIETDVNDRLESLEDDLGNHIEDFK